MKEITNNDLLNSLRDHIKYNWNASLGYGKDEKIVRRALEDFNWILNLLDIDSEYFIRVYFIEQ